MKILLFWNNLLSSLHPEAKKENPPKREDFLRKALRDCQQELENAYRGMQNTNEPDLIDRYIYEWNAANLRYKVLLRDIRETLPEPSSTTSETKVPVLPSSLHTPVFQTSPSKTLVSSAKISSTNLETETSLLNRSFR